MTKTRDLCNDDLMELAQKTYDKNAWTAADVRILRECWNEFEKRGGYNALMFFRPAYFCALKVHEIESGEVNEAEVERMEMIGAEIATDYREIMRKLEAACIVKLSARN